MKGISEPRDLTAAEIADLQADLVKAHATPMPPQTVAELEAWIKEHFHCMDGPPMAYFEIPFDDSIGRLVYVKLGFLARGLGHERALVLEIYKALLPAVELDSQQYKNLLFWRRHLKYEEIGGRWKHSKLACRLVIPGFTFQNATADGAIYQTIEVQS